MIMVGAKGSVSSLLVETADEVLSLQDDVLPKRTVNTKPTPSGIIATTTPPTTPARAPAIATAPVTLPVTTPAATEPVTKPATAPEASPATARVTTPAPVPVPATKPTTLPAATPATRPAIPSTEEASDELLKILCRIVHDSPRQSEDEWIELGGISALLQQIIRKKMPSIDYKEKAKDLRNQAASRKLIAMGRRKLHTVGQRVIMSSCDPKLKFSDQVYIRLLPAGEQLATSNAAAAAATKISKPPAGKIPVNKKNRTVFVRLLPRGMVVQELVTFLQDSYDVTICRALMEYSEYSSGTSNALVELSSSQEATLLLEEANKAIGGGMSYRGKTIGIVNNTRHTSLDRNKSYNERVFYEQKPETTGECNTLTSNNSATTDSHKFCLCVFQATVTQQHAWIGGGSIGAAFRNKLSQSFLDTASKEDINLRFKEARKQAMRNGWIGMGKRKLDAPELEYATVLSLAANHSSSERLSPEHYLRILPAGRTLVEQKQPTSVKISLAVKTRVADVRKCLFSNNFPAKCSANDVAVFFESTLGCLVDRVETQDHHYKGAAATAAHVQLEALNDLSKVLRKSKVAGGLMYRGRKIYVAPNRTTPAAIASKYGIKTETNMSFNRQLHETKNDPQEASDANGEVDGADDSIALAANKKDETVDMLDMEQVDDTFGILGINDTASENLGIGLGGTATPPKDDPFADLLWT